MNRIFNLKVEYRVKPLGISTLNPRFSWMLSSDKQGTKQVFYRIFVVESKSDILQGKYIWDSKKTEGEKPFAIRYAGVPLKERTKYYWYVEVWDNYGNQIQSEVSTFETGFFSLDSWKAKWITASKAEGCVHARATFVVPQDKTIESARLYSASTAGAFGDVSLCMNCVYLTLNGDKVGKDAMMPGQILARSWRAVYRTYDITDSLVVGENVVGVVFVSMAYSACVCVRFTDGSEADYWLGDVFKVNGNGPYTLWDVGVGEHGGKKEDYDSSKEFTGFDKPDYNDLNWKKPVYTDVVTCLEEQSTTVEVIEELNPISVQIRWEGHYIVDFGQVIHGHVRLRIENPRYKQRISVVYAEGVYSNGELDPYSTINYHHGENGPHKDTYVTKGDGIEIFEPRFSNHSFRYLDIYNYPGELKADNIQGLLVHSPVLSDSNFMCSDDDINGIFKISHWSQRDNLLSIPTDCPSRERLGWMADAWCVCEAEILNFDLQIFMEDWCKVIRENQFENGYVPYICPPPKVFNNTDVPWSTACVLVPWFVFERYGDDSILRNTYSVMEKWLAYIASIADENYQLKKGVLWGDHTRQIDTDGNLLGMVYYCINCDYMAKVSFALGKDGAKYEELSNKIRVSIREKYLGDGCFPNDSQGEIAHGLALGLLEKEKAIVRLEKDLKMRSDLLTCGCLGIYHLINEFSKAERNDLIYDICKCDKEGSFLSWIKNHDATTSFEFLHFYESASKNHPFLTGSIVAWFYQGLAGIKRTSVGYRTFDIVPYLPKEMEFVEATIETYYGNITFKLEKIFERLRYKLTIPCGTTACLYIANETALYIKNERDHTIYEIQRKDGKQFVQLKSGIYHFII